MSLRSNLLSAVIAAASYSLVPAALAQQEEPMPPPEGTTEQMPPAQQSTEPQTTTPGATAAAEPLDDKKIEQFADAYLAVQTIQQKASSDMQATTDPAQADKVKATAESDMIAAVERSGLQVDEFNRIVETMASNEDVRSRVVAKLQERGGTKPN